MTAGEYLALAAGWEHRQRQVMPLAIIALVCMVLGATIWWPWFLGMILGAPYIHAWIQRAKALTAVDDIFSS